MPNVRLDKSQARMKIAGRNVKNLRTEIREGQPRKKQCSLGAGFWFHLMGYTISLRSLQNQNPQQTELAFFTAQKTT